SLTPSLLCSQINEVTETHGLEQAVHYLGISLSYQLSLMRVKSPIVFHEFDACSLAEEFAEAAGQLKKEIPNVRFGKVDVSDQKDLKKEFNIQEFPTVKFFNPSKVFTAGEASAFITWVKRRLGPSTVHINSTDQTEAIIEAEELAVIGFFKVIQWESQKLIGPRGIISKDQFYNGYGIRKDTAVVFKKVGMVKPFVFQTSVKIFDVPVENHILLFTPKNSETFNKTYENYESAAVEFRGKIMFILVDTNETRNGRVFEYFRITEVDVPAVRILNLTSDARYKMPADEVTVENLRSFCQSYLAGKAKQHVSSEEIPEDWDKNPVKVLVGKNFNQVAFNKTKNVFVMFYAPWSHECRKLLPIWDELAEEYENRKDIIIAKVDFTANDIQLFMLDRYPFFRLFPAGSDNQVVVYAGEHTLEAFAEFLNEQSKPKAEATGKVKDSMLCALRMSPVQFKVALLLNASVTESNLAVGGWDATTTYLSRALRRLVLPILKPRLP
uniref:Protein disulfide isomerase like, testis expressed n=1 Tax=Crocodylus porosus TaxID=8502 RepID=A0A7M4EGQ8_CROPO